MKGRARLEQSPSQQSTEKIGFFKDFSSPRKADSGSLKKRDSAGDSAALFDVSRQFWWVIWPASTAKISPDAPTSAKAAGSAPVIQTCAPSFASSSNSEARRAGS